MDGGWEGVPPNMTEGRKSQVVLLDDRRLDIVVQPKLYAGELLDLVASHFNLKEKEYFGLAFQDDTGHSNWLNSDRKVLEHDFPKKAGVLVLYFSVRFYIESITYLKDIATVELFFLQAKQAIFKDIIECDSESAFELAACALQATNGDYTDDESARQQLRKLPVLPTSALREHPSIAYCEEQVIEHYIKLAGQSRGSAIVNYMTIVESLPTYGIHYYEVKDKSSLPWLLGLSFKGISQYDHNDRKTPRRVFAWKQLENLYFRDKKFSIEVHDPKRIVHTLSSFNLYEDAIQEAIEDFDDLSDAISDPTTQVSVSRRTFGPGNVNVHAWFAATPQLTKCIWSMAVNQHQFYLDRKQSKTQLPAVRSMTEIAADLCQSMTSLPSSGPSDGMSRSNSAHSLSKISTNSSKMDILEEQDPSRALKLEYFQTLKARKEVLEEKLKEKTELLKALCIKEGELTGVLPAETPIAPGEATPTVRRRVGTEFSLSPKVMNSNEQEEEQYLNKVELEYDLQDKIAKAAQKLAQDKSVAKTVRKRRKQSCHRAHQKLKELEKKVNEARRYAGLGSIKGVSSVEEPEFVSPMGTPALQRHQHPGMPRQHSAPQVQVFSSPHVEVVEVENRSTGSSSHSSLAGIIPQTGGVSNQSPTADRKYHGSYTPSAVHSTRNQYRTQMYPSYTPPRDQAPYDGPQDGGRNGYPGTPTRAVHPQYDGVHQYAGRTANYDHSHMQAHAHNAYNIQHSRGGYKSADELEEGQINSHETGYSDDELYNKPKYGSLEGHYRNRQREFMEGRFGSLERNRSSPLLLPELSPSKFGSKRESTCDHKDSMYPYPCGDECVLNSRVQFHIGDQDNHVRDLRAQFQQQIDRNEGVPGEHGYPQGHPRQQEPPHTPQYQPGPPAFFQEQQTVNSVPNTESPNQLMVKKHQGYVEMSKPFEMSDFYKYSERIRKQRTVDNYSVRTGQNYNRTAQGYNPAQYNPNYPYGARTGQVAQSRSRPSSPYSQGDDSSQHSQDMASYAGNSRTMTGPYMPQPVHGGYAVSHQSQRTIHLQQPKPMTCEPVQDPHKHPPNRSEPYMNIGDGVPEEEPFSDQSGVAWYSDQAQDRTSTLV